MTSTFAIRTMDGEQVLVEGSCLGALFAMGEVLRKAGKLFEMRTISEREAKEWVQAGKRNETTMRRPTARTGLRNPNWCSAKP